MSLTNLVATTAVEIAERRRGKLGAEQYAGRTRFVVERNILAVKTSNLLQVVSGFFEPLFFLLAFGFGVGQLIGQVTDASGNPVDYRTWIVPALLATSAMNGALMDATWNVYFKMHFARLYNGMLATSMGPLDVALGEIAWSLIRGAGYATAFMIVVTPLGLVPSIWGILAIPAAVLIAFGFAAVGMAATTYTHSIQQLQWISFFTLPMFMFSGTFYPITAYPAVLQTIIQALPLWQGASLIRGLTFGQIDGALLGHVLYFAIMIAGGLWLTSKRLTKLFMS